MIQQSCFLLLAQKELKTCPHKNMHAAVLRNSLLTAKAEDNQDVRQ